MRADEFDGMAGAWKGGIKADWVLVVEGTLGAVQANIPPIKSIPAAKAASASTGLIEDDRSRRGPLAALARRWAS